MAYITLHKDKLKHNFHLLDQRFKQRNITWAVVSKVLCGTRNYLEFLLSLQPDQICDSRVSNLKEIKKINPNIETIYIKPPAKRSIKSIVKFADISMNTSFETIQWLDEEARRQGKIHKIIIMIEMGELREGVMRDDLIDFYESVFKLANIDVIGIGTNLTCLYGVLPNHDKLIQLSLYEQLIEAKFNRPIEFVSGGSSVTIPLLDQGIMPDSINHFRVGESLFLGTNPYDNTALPGMHTDVFTLYAEIIELIEKPATPDGDLGQNVEGNSYEFSDDLIGKTAHRALLDVGLLDVEPDHLKPLSEGVTIAGASSDIVVVDLGENKHNYKVGQLLKFKLDYMGLLRVLNSFYVEKKLEGAKEATADKVEVTITASKN